MPECNKCSAELTLSRKGGWFCKECGSRVAEDEAALAQAALGEGRGLAAVVTRDLREPLADVGAAYFAEVGVSEPDWFRAFHRLIDAFEAAVSFSAMLASLGYVHSHVRVPAASQARRHAWRWSSSLSGMLIRQEMRPAGEGVCTMERDWNLLATSSHYKTAVAVHEELRAGDIKNAISGLEELIEALSRSDERALESYLTRLMQHIIKWKLQPERRTPIWVSTIRYARRQVRKLQKENPRFTDDWIRAQWNDMLEGAADEAQTDLGQEIDKPSPLTWTEVFDAEYRVEKRDR